MGTTDYETSIIPQDFQGLDSEFNFVINPKCLVCCADQRATFKAIYYVILLFLTVFVCM